MFRNTINVETTPERVFELCKLVSRQSDTEKALRERLDPTILNSGSSFFGMLSQVGRELNLIQKDGNRLVYCGDKAAVESYEAFRRYCNATVWQNTDSYFYQLMRCLIESDDRWLCHSTLTKNDISAEIRAKTNIEVVESKYMLAVRFWAAFLGFGYVYEGANTIQFLPNMYVALRDFLRAANVQPGTEYAVAEFMNVIASQSTVATEGAIPNETLSLALSNALRQMHDRGEIVLCRHLDSEKVWRLFRNTAHPIVSEITHIQYKGVEA